MRFAWGPAAAAVLYLACVGVLALVPGGAGPLREQPTRPASLTQW
jgi:hypothetical protein